MLTYQEKQNIKSYLPDYLQQYHNVDISRTFKCLSPEHYDEHPSMSYSPRLNICHCFACGKSYDIFSLIADDYNIDPKDFKSILKKVEEIYPGSYREKNKIPEIKEEDYEPVDYSDYFKECHNKVDKTDYLRKRGISEEMIEKYNLGYDTSKNLCIFPVDQNCYFARGTSGNFKMNTKGNMNCWGEEKLKNSKESDFIIITESIIDAISLEQINNKYPVISLNGGTRHEKLLEAISKYDYKGNVIIATDNDYWGVVDSEKIKEILKEKGVKYAFYYPFTHDYKDINEALLNNPQELINSYNYLSDVLSQIQKSYVEENRFEME